MLSDFGGSESAFGVAVQADGRIVAAGPTTWLEAGHPSDFALARYTRSGKLDASFGKSGKVVTDLGGDGDFARAVAMQPDGKILVAGQSDARDQRGDFALLRYTRSGKLDASFGSGGKVLTDLADHSLDEASALAVQPDGKILVAGRSWNTYALVRLTARGQLDASFGRGGKVLTNLGSETRMEHLQS